MIPDGTCHERRFAPGTHGDGQGAVTPDGTEDNRAKLGTINHIYGNAPASGLGRHRSVGFFIRRGGDDQLKPGTVTVCVFARVPLDQAPVNGMPNLGVDFRRNHRQGTPCRKEHFDLVCGNVAAADYQAREQICLKVQRYEHGALIVGPIDRIPNQLHFQDRRRDVRQLTLNALLLSDRAKNCLMLPYFKGFLLHLLDLHRPLPHDESKESPAFAGQGFLRDSVGPSSVIRPLVIGKQQSLRRN
jgi:hypothetical protein